MRVPATPAHLYPAALVADADGGDADAFELPADLTALSAEFDEAGVLTGGDLRDLLDSAIAAFDGLHDVGVDGPEALADLTALAESIDSIRAEVDTRSGAVLEAQEAAEALRGRVHPAASDEGDEAGDEGDDAAGDPVVELEAAVEGEEADEATLVVEPEAVPASGRRVSLARIRNRQPAPPAAPEPSSGMVLTAAAEVPGFSGGSEVEPSNLGAMAHARARSIGRSDGATAMIASVHTDYDVAVGARDSRDTQAERIEEARSIPDEGLVAAGGWCAPNDRRWDFFSIESVGGLYTMPVIGIERGGLDFPVSPSLADVADAVWEWSEEDDIAALDNDGSETDVVKPCFRIPCGEWESERLGVHGVCVTAGNLSTEAWPEQNRRYVDLVLATHEIAMSNRLLSRVRALTISVTIAATAGALAPLLSAIELQAADYREQHRMAETALLEAVFPLWVTGAIRADLSRRAGIPVEDVTNAQITAWFQSRGVAPQFVHGLQSVRTTAGSIPLVWPAQVEFLLYAAGTYVNGRGPRLDLGVSRDSRLNAVNDHMVLFTEEADLVAMVGFEGRSVTVPIITDGRTGAATYEATAAIA